MRRGCPADYSATEYTRYDREAQKSCPRPHVGDIGNPALGDTVYVASADRSVSAIYAPTGKLLWRTLSEGSYLSVAVCKNKVFANDLGLDVRDRRTGAIIDRVLASREDASYAGGGIGTDGVRIFATSTIGTYAIAC